MSGYEMPTSWAEASDDFKARVRARIEAGLDLPADAPLPPGYERSADTGRAIEVKGSTR